MTTRTDARIPTFTFGDRLRKAREVAGVGVQEMADLLLVSRNTVTRYEAEASRITEVRLRRWAEVTGVPIGWLRSGAEVADDLGESASTWVRALSVPLVGLLTAA